MQNHRNIWRALLVVVMGVVAITTRPASGAAATSVASADPGCITGCCACFTDLDCEQVDSSFLCQEIGCADVIYCSDFNCDNNWNFLECAV